MAKSHHDVGVAFGKLQSAVGSRMSCTAHSPVFSDTPHNFYAVSAGVSYRTIVARIMRNKHTGRNELWITPRRYSNSTERHKNYMLNGYRKAHQPTDRWFDDVYYTPCIDSGQFRNNPDHVYNTIGYINEQLKQVDAPRLREATRRGTLTACLHRADVAMTNFSRNMPLDLIDATALYELQTMIGFLTTTLANPSIDEVRAAVKGHLALLETAQ